MKSSNNFAPAWPSPTNSTRKETKMSANKLSHEQKTLRKALKAEFTDAKGILIQQGMVTFAFAPTCRNKAHVSWAICSQGEIYNRKRGELVALSRWNCGETLPIEYAYVNTDTFVPMTVKICQGIAEMLWEGITVP